MKKFIFGIAFLLLCLAILVWFFERRPCDPPDKPEGLPQEAHWIGGCDGGHWVEMLELDGEEVRFKIYRDWDGQLLLDADFTIPDCLQNQLTNTNWMDFIAYYSSDLFIRDEYASEQPCILEMVEPAYFELPVD